MGATIMPELQCYETEKSCCSKKEFTFRPFTLEDKDLIDRYIKPWGTECSALTFTSFFIWGKGGKMEFCEKDDMLFIKYNFKDIPVHFCAPVPKFGVQVDYRKGIQDAVNYMKKVGAEPTFRSVSAPFAQMMRKAYPELYFTPTEIAWDYIYDREKMETLKGKKLHGKRNHINKFLSLYPEYEYRKLDETMIKDCIQLYDQWSEEKEEPTEEYIEERKSVLLALNNMEALGLVGGTIFIEGKLVAFTVGERLLPQMELIHIEKADHTYEGLYPMINQQFVLHECMDVELINREEDMGIEGLRKAKRAYYPVKMVEKDMFSVNDLRGVRGIWGKDEEV